MMHRKTFARLYRRFEELQAQGARLFGQPFDRHNRPKRFRRTAHHAEQQSSLRIGLGFALMDCSIKNSCLRSSWLKPHGVGIKKYPEPFNHAAKSCRRHRTVGRILVSDNIRQFDIRYQYPTY